MNTNLHLNFQGNCDEAFSFYETVFGTERPMTSRWRDAPAEFRCPPGAENLVMHTALRVGTITLMGADALPGQQRAFSAFDISLDHEDEQEARRLFAALSQGGTVRMPLQPTFWTSLFGMCTDRFGVSWMVSIPGPAV